MLCDRGRQNIVRFRWRPTLPAPDDDFVLELAIAARCSFIVTYNRRDFSGFGDIGIQAVTPQEFWRTITPSPKRARGVQLSGGSLNWQDEKIWQTGKSLRRLSWAARIRSREPSRLQSPRRRESCLQKTNLVCPDGRRKPNRRPQVACSSNQAARPLFTCFSELPRL